MVSHCVDCISYPGETGICSKTKKHMLDIITDCKDFKEVKHKKNSSESKEPEKEPEAPQHIKEKAKEIMEKGDPVKFLFDTHQKEHVGDELISKTLIVGVGCQSANNTSGIQPKLDGASGKGKSHSAKAFMKFIPKSHKIEGSCSDKVLYYKPDMKDGTVIYSDDISISDDMTGTIKRATTNYQDITTHHTLNKDREPESHSLPKRIMWLLTSVENNQSMQLLNRQFGGSVDETAQQDDSVFDYQVMNGMLGRVEFSDSDDVLVCREIIRDIKNHVFTVVIPYSYLIEWKNKDNRRNFTMFTDMIAGFAIYRYKQRVVDGEYLFADLQDFDDAELLYGNRNIQQRTKLTDTELKICDYLSSVNDADVKSIQDNTRLTPTRISQLMNGKTDTDTGLLFKVKGLSVEDISVKIDIPDKQGEKIYKPAKAGRQELIGSTSAFSRKKVYKLVGFDYENYKESVVSIGNQERIEFNRLNHDLTTALLLKIKNGSELLTYLTIFNNIHKNGKYEQKLKYILFGKNGVNSVNTSQPIANGKGKVVVKTSTGNENGNIPNDLENHLLDFYKDKNVLEYTPSDIGFHIRQVMPQYSQKSNEYGAIFIEEMTP
jgi:hypothetical protein